MSSFICWNGSDGSGQSDGKPIQAFDAQTAAGEFAELEWNDSAGEVGEEFCVVVLCPDGNQERWDIHVDYSPDFWATKAAEETTP